MDDSLDESPRSLSRSSSHSILTVDYSQLSGQAENSVPSTFPLTDDQLFPQLENPGVAIRTIQQETPTPIPTPTPRGQGGPCGRRYNLKMVRNPMCMVLHL